MGLYFHHQQRLKKAPSISPYCVGDHYVRQCTLWLYLNTTDVYKDKSERLYYLTPGNKVCACTNRFYQSISTSFLIIYFVCLDPLFHNQKSPNGHPNENQDLKSKDEKNQALRRYNYMYRMFLK